MSECGRCGCVHVLEGCLVLGEALGECDGMLYAGLNPISRVVC